MFRDHSVDRSRSFKLATKGNKIPSYFSERGVLPETADHPNNLNRRGRRLAAKAIRHETSELKALPNRLGNPNLEMHKSEANIRYSFIHNPVTVIRGPTGCGKSTQVPQMVMNMGKDCVMTQPRRLAAYEVTKPVSEEVHRVWESASPSVIGCVTGEKNSTRSDTQTAIVTDGVELRYIGDENRPDNPNQITLLDEVHEYNINIEIALALMKRKIKEDPTTRCGLMSATIDVQELVDFFSDVTPTPPEVIDIPFRTFDIDKREEPESTVAESAFRLQQQEGTGLCFVAGKAEINDTIDELYRLYRQNGLKRPTILGLHAKMSNTEQEAALSPYANGKIVVSTNVAQTSLTIPDIKFVVDSGEVRQSNIDEEGTQSLDKVPISQDDSDQRAGRAGRVSDGIYVLTRQSKDSDFISYSDREEHAVPEILRTEVDRSVLYVAAMGIDFADLELLHPIKKEVIQRAKRALRGLGALDESGDITPLGRKMEALPMGPRLARMMVESEQYSETTRAQVAAIAASIEAGGLAYFAPGEGKRWQELTNETSSDYLAQLELYITSMSMTRKEQSEYNLDVRNIERAEETFRKVAKRTNFSPDALKLPNDDERGNIKRCIYAGMINDLYRYSGDGRYVKVGDTAGNTRAISDRSVVVGKAALVVGTPFRYSYMSGGELKTNHILEGVTKVSDPSALAKFAVNSATWATTGMVLRNGQLKEAQAQQISGVDLGISREEEATLTPENVEYLVEFMMANQGTALRELCASAKTIKDFYHLSPTAPQPIDGMIKSLVEEAVINSHLDADYADQLLREMIVERSLTVNDILPPNMQQKILEDSPSTHEAFGQVFSLKYRRGAPLVARYNLEEAAQLPGEVTLQDGRAVRFIGKHGKHYSVSELQAGKHIDS